MSALRRALALVLALCCLGFLPVRAADEDVPAAETGCAHPGWQNGICVACGMIIGHLSSQNSFCFLFGSISICELLIQLKTCRLDATGKTL